MPVPALILTLTVAGSVFALGALSGDGMVSVSHRRELQSRALLISPRARASFSAEAWGRLGLAYRRHSPLAKITGIR